MIKKITFLLCLCVAFATASAQAVQSNDVYFVDAQGNKLESDEIVVSQIEQGSQYNGYRDCMPCGVYLRNNTDKFVSIVLEFTILDANGGYFEDDLRSKIKQTSDLLEIGTENKANPVFAKWFPETAPTGKAKLKMKVKYVKDLEQPDDEEEENDEEEETNDDEPNYSVIGYGPDITVVFDYQAATGIEPLAITSSERVHVYNLQGTLLNSSSLQNLPQGIYIVKSQSGNNLTNFKKIIVK